MPDTQTPELDAQKKADIEEANRKLDDTLRTLGEAEAKTKDEIAKLEQTQTRTAEEQSKLDAIKKEHERIMGDITVARDEKRKLAQKDASFADKFRAEQLVKAQERFYQEFGYEDESAKIRLAETFSKVDSGAFDAELIYQDLVRAHLVSNPSKYIEMEKEHRRMRQEADQFIQQQGTYAFREGTSDFGQLGGDVELSSDDLRAAAWAGLTPEAYKELKRQGKV